MLDVPSIIMHEIPEEGVRVIEVQRRREMICVLRVQDGADGGLSLHGDLHDNTTYILGSSR